ncbi:hypothetical protein [Roseibium sp.]|uniref:hypothetical protein n=1 Tax=Roseibium sp. TaxID=1936156 RepID=UPI003D1419F8
MRKFLLPVVSCLFLTACSVGGQIPSEDNDTFFNQAKSHRYADTMEFTVPRSVGAVAKSFQAGAPCLNRRVEEISYGPRSGGRSVSNYRGVVVSGPGSVTLNLRRQGTTAVVGGTNAEYRLAMAEARAVPGGSRIRIAGPSTNYDDVYRAMSQWARGNPAGCPKFRI